MVLPVKEKRIRAQVLSGKKVDKGKVKAMTEERPTISTEMSIQTRDG